MHAPLLFAEQTGIISTYVTACTFTKPTSALGLQAYLSPWVLGSIVGVAGSPCAVVLLAPI